MRVLNESMSYPSLMFQCVEEEIMRDLWTKDEHAGRGGMLWCVDGSHELHTESQNLISTQHGKSSEQTPCTDTSPMQPTSMHADFVSIFLFVVVKCLDAYKQPGTKLLDSTSVCGEECMLAQLTRLSVACRRSTWN